jgi:hypothetical protein
MAPEDPLVSAMLLCEHVHADSASGKHTLFGVFDEVQASRFPIPGRYVLRLTMNRRHLRDYVVIAMESPE